MVRPWVAQAQATFTTVVDERNVLADSLGFSAVPTLLLFDGRGRLALGPIHFDVRRAGMADAILAWARGEGISAALAQPRMDAANSDEAARLFRQGQERLAAGERAAALTLWRRARDLAPHNWLIRKQIWAVEHPARFYDGPVDFDWQREQLAREQA